MHAAVKERWCGGGGGGDDDDDDEDGVMMMMTFPMLLGPTMCGLHPRVFAKRANCTDVAPENKDARPRTQPCHPEIDSAPSVTVSAPS
eukprot:3923439-Rhodomonas_salina.2